MANIDIDTSEVLTNLKLITPRIELKLNKTLFEIAAEVLRLAEKENPHDKGILQSSQAIEPEGAGYVLGYNKEYAARLHEHPEYNFQKGRKGKYLEDPIKNNVKQFLNYLGEQLKKALQ